jgi:tetratricopeptide (TPR) repeat protein
MPSPPETKTFATRLLPSLIGAGAFILFVLTLNHWVSLQSLGTVARVSGWLWRPQLEQPLSAAIFFPFTFLPKIWIPLALNLFTAVCAAIVLMLLARSVALLPHDLARNEPFPTHQPAAILSIPTAWIPPLLATVLCALQLSFWEHATSATGEIIDLLVFAYVIRCLLEFRLDQQQFRLSRAAFAFGLGMANNWAMVGFFPIFLIALVRAKGYGPFREARFLRPMTACWLLGLSLFLLLPLLQVLSPNGQVDFWTGLKAHLKSQLEFLSYLRRPRFRILAVASLLPVIVLSIRWKSHTVQFADDTRFGNFLTKSTVHLVHGLLFLVSLWIALDPTFSPRNLDLGTSMLTFYYLSAMMFGYCCGYFLLFGSQARESAQQHSMSSRAWSKFQVGLEKFVQRFVPIAAVCFLLVLPALLLWRNLGQVLETNGPLLRKYVRELYADLPPGTSVVLSDDPIELLLLEAHITRRRMDKQPMLLDAPSLTSEHYQALMAKKFASRWPAESSKNSGKPGNVLKLISSFAVQEPLFYLHPGFGPLFELFYGQPHGLTYKLVPRVQYDRIEPRESIDEKDRNKNFKVVGPEIAGAYPVFTDAEVTRIAGIWNERWTRSLQFLVSNTKQKPGYSEGAARKLLARLCLARESNRTLSFVGAGYSKRLNYWGVQLQRQGHGSEAMTCYQRAIELNPDNLTAHINFEYGRRTPADRLLLTVPAIQNTFSEIFAKFGNLREILKANGPVDEPSFLFRTGRMLLDSGNTIQAMESFQRCLELAPDWAAPKLWLAECLVQFRSFAAAFDATQQLQASGALKDGPALAHLLQCRVSSLKGLGRTNEAIACLESYATQFATQKEVLSTAAELYRESRQFDKEYRLIEDLLKTESNRPDLLCRKGLAQLQLSQYEAAIATLTAALNLVPKNEHARLYRAVAYLGLGQLEPARSDYQELLSSSTDPRNALFGLGTVAWRQAKTNQAIHYYEQFLSNRVSVTRQERLAVERLKELRRIKDG